MNEKNLTLRVSQLNIVINALLALSKISVGVLAHSVARDRKSTRLNSSHL